jgi:aspartate aminotransferase
VSKSLPTTLTISRRAGLAPASPIRKLAPYAEAAKARGITVRHLNIGQPDFETPPAVLDAITGFSGKVLAYAPSEGLPESRQAWSDYFAAQALDIPAERILVTVGGSEAIMFAIAVVADPGESVLVLEPTYANYCGFAANVSVRLQPVALDAATGYALPTMGEIEAALDTSTRAILLCNPNNPTGSVYDRAVMADFVALAERRGLFLIVDEAYREFVYDGTDYASVLAIAPRSPNVIVVDSTSKRFNACGARIGCLTTMNKDVYQSALRLAQARLSAPTVEQLALNPLLRDPLPYTKPLVEAYRRRRDAAMSHIRAIPGVGYSQPNGAFYTVVRLPLADSEDFARWMLETFSDQGETVFVAPMPGFYITPGLGFDEVRLAFVLEEARLRRACELLGLGVASYNQR